MKCPYDEPLCIHLLKDGHCNITTCYDEYDMVAGVPFPNKETEDYWSYMEKTEGGIDGY